MKQLFIFILFLPLVGCGNIIKNKQTSIDFNCPRVFFHLMIEFISIIVFHLMILRLKLNLIIMLLIKNASNKII